MSAKKRHFVVERLNWRTFGDTDGARKNAGARALLPGAERVASFLDAGEADVDCRRREGEARKVVNPFGCGVAFCYLTSLDEGRLGDWVQDAGLTPPDKQGIDAWRTWWDEQEPRLSES